MSTFVYNNARYLLGTAGLNWPSLGTVKAALVNASYSPLPTDVYLTSVPGGAVVGTAATMTGLAVRTSGVCYGTIPQFNALASPTQVVGVVIYQDTGNPASSPLIYYSSDGLGFPFLPQGFNYAVGYDLSNGGFFQA